MFGQVNLTLVVLTFSIAAGCTGWRSEMEAPSGNALVDLSSQSDVDKLNSLVGLKVSIVGELYSGKGNPFLSGKCEPYVEINIGGRDQSFEASDFGAIMTVTGHLRVTADDSISDSGMISFSQGDGGGNWIIDHPAWVK